MDKKPTDEHATDEHATDEHATDEHATDEHATDELAGCASTLFELIAHLAYCALLLGFIKYIIPIISKYAGGGPALLSLPLLVFGLLLANDALERPRAPWWPVAFRGLVLLGVPLLLLVVLREYLLRTQIADMSRITWWLALFIVLPMLALVFMSIIRYRRFRREDPLEPSRLHPSRLDVTIRESRVALDPWRSLDLASSHLSAEGKLAGMKAFALRMACRMPWLRRTGFQAVIRAAVQNEHVVARFDASSTEVFPEEARAVLDGFLERTRASLAAHPGWVVLVTPGDLLLSLPTSPPPGEVVRIMDRLASDWGHVERPRPAGYRDIQPPAAMPGEVARIDRLADELWSALPDVPKEKHA